MLSRLVLVCRVKGFLFLTFVSIVTTDKERVVEVNEKDLNDHGINVNPSDIDLLLPVVNPLRKSPLTSKTFLQSHRTNTDRPKFEQQINNIRLSDAVLEFAKPWSKHAVTSFEEHEKKETPMETSNANNHESVHQSKKELSVEETSTDNKAIMNLTNKKLQSKQLYNNVRDFDEPVTIKKTKKLRPPLTKEKQEILNNTLSYYDMRLDAKGKTIILKDDQRPHEKSKQRNNHHDDITKELKTVEDEMKGKKSLKFFNQDRFLIKKAKKQDLMKSLWDIVKKVSRRWK